VQPLDFTLPGNSLTDTATLNWTDLCTGTSSNCNPNPQTATAVVHRHPATDLVDGNFDPQRGASDGDCGGGWDDGARLRERDRPAGSPIRRAT